MKDINLRTVQELMGHKTIQMTVRYAHLAPGQKLAAVQRLCEPAEPTDSPKKQLAPELAPVLSVQLQNKQKHCSKMFLPSCTCRNGRARSSTVRAEDS